MNFPTLNSRRLKQQLGQAFRSEHAIACVILSLLTNNWTQVLLRYVLRCQVWPKKMRVQPDKYYLKTSLSPRVRKINCYRWGCYCCCCVLHCNHWLTRGMSLTKRPRKSESSSSRINDDEGDEDAGAGAAASSFFLLIIRCCLLRRCCEEGGASSAATAAAAAEARTSVSGFSASSSLSSSSTYERGTAGKRDQNGHGD